MAARCPGGCRRRRRRVPGTKPRDYAALCRLMFAGRKATIADVVPTKGAVWDRLMRPFLLAALNTEPETASAQLAGAGDARDLGAGRARLPSPHRHAQPWRRPSSIPRWRFWRRNGAKVELGKRLRTLVLRRPRGAGAGISRRHRAARRRGHGGAGGAALGGARNWCPISPCPTNFAPSSTRISASRAPKGAPPMLGVISGTAEWIFSFQDRISVTVSGADAIVDRDREELARAVVARRLRRRCGSSADLPRWQIVKEKRATFAATPEQDIKRPPAKTALAQSVAGRRLDRYRPARHHRRRGAFGRSGGGFGAQASRFIVAAA